MMPMARKQTAAMETGCQGAAAMASMPMPEEMTSPPLTMGSSSGRWRRTLDWAQYPPRRIPARLKTL